jgi:hypothetical protein
MGGGQQQQQQQVAALREAERQVVALQGMVSPRGGSGTRGAGMGDSG